MSLWEGGLCLSALCGTLLTLILSTHCGLSLGITLRGADLPPQQRPGLQKSQLAMNPVCPHNLASSSRTTFPWVSSAPSFLQGFSTHCIRDRHFVPLCSYSLSAAVVGYLPSHESALSVSSSSCLLQGHLLSFMSQIGLFGSVYFSYKPFLGLRGEGKFLFYPR